MPQSRAPVQVRRASRPPAPARRSKLFYVVLLFTALSVLALIVATELQASRLQAYYFSAIARDMKFGVQPGPSTSIRFPQPGPYDQRLGYSELPTFIRRLEKKGYEIDAQARVTQQLGDLIEAGYAPPYPEKTQAGLQVLDCRATQLFNFAYPER